MTSKLEHTDLQILAELDLNARETTAEIGRKLNLSKYMLNYRIKNLEKKGIIKGYSTLINFLGLDYLSYRVHLRLQYADNKTEKEIMDYLKKSRFSWWCSYVKGSFDICVLFWSKTPEQFIDLWDDFRKKYRLYIKEAVVEPYYGFTQCSLPFTKHLLKKRKNNAAIGVGELPKIDKKDKRILLTLSSNARAPLSKIAKAVGLSVGAVKNRIDQLIKKKVIVGFKPLIDMKRIGYTYYKVLLNLRSLEDQKKIEQYVLNNVDVLYFVRTAGWADLEMGVYTKTPGELFDVLDRIRDKFSSQIRDYDFFTYQRIVKESFMPDF